MNRKKLLTFLTSKMMIIAYIILLEFLVLMGFITVLSEFNDTINLILRALSVLMVLYIYNKDDNPSFKILWIILILIIPLFGGVLYLLFGGRKVPKELMRKFKSGHQSINEALVQDDLVIEKLRNIDEEAYKQAYYLSNNSGFPVYENTETTFLKSGEVYIGLMIDEMRKAEKYIFLEYFIIEEGYVWNTIFDLLKEKVKAGVDVRLLFDDAGCINKLEDKYDAKIREAGIQCKVFNPIHPQLAIQMNNRDHRKITVIDGKVGFTGGINLADEYVNIKEVFGHWRDQGVMLKGEAVYNFSLMFLQFWDHGEKTTSDYVSYKELTCNQSDGFVLPFSDAPTDGECVGENVHLSVINAANRYVYIQTPYLILDHQMIVALQLAAKGGVDVRIMVPHIPDKKLVFQVTQANYRDLLASGVKIYEFTPGFVHAKTIVSDDKFGVIGSINFDFRSYYLHFECGVWMYQSSANLKLKEDFLATLEQCHEVTYQEYLKTNVLLRAIRSIANLFAPLM